MSDCRKCAEFDWCKENEDCGLFKPKPQTNADRFRSMTDEELATWLVNPKPLKKYLRDEIGLPPYLSPSESDILSWLKQEANDVE